jgi:alkanesulfonate monooxygenase SsuD/methylene tetrahydromethanopterin reductase-like flavin-dependent oxidoreductase (luciferase family)
MVGEAGERLALATGAMSITAVVAAVRDAEAAGCEAALIGEGVREADAFVASAAALSSTRRIRVGPGVVTVHDRHPAALARAAATLDRLAPGRAVLGVGRGERASVETGLGLPWEGSQAALSDTLHICRALLSGTAVDHHGERWSARLDALPRRAAPQTPIPLLLAAVGARTLRLAGAAADGVLLNYGATPEYIRWATAQVAAGAAAAGRPPDAVDVYGYVLVARTDLGGDGGVLARIRDRLRSLLANRDQAAALLAPIGLDAATPLDDSLVERLAAVGTGAQVRERIAALVDAGVRCPVVLPSGLRALLE